MVGERYPHYWAWLDVGRFSILWVEPVVVSSEVC